MDAGEWKPFICLFRTMQEAFMNCLQAITRSRAANSKKEVETKANQKITTTTSECFNVCHQKYF